jgi:lipid A 4'-phosphatase
MKALYVLSSLLLTGPLISDLAIKPLLKRSRPGKVLNFSEFYTPPLQIGKKCQSNCSFISSEVAIATTFVSLAVFMGSFRKKWLIISSVWVVLISIVRMAQIGHYLSDVLFAVLLSLIVMEFLRYFFSNKEALALWIRKSDEY